MSKIYVASDTAPDDVASYELCSDFINAIMDLTDLYGWDRRRLRGGEAVGNGVDGPASHAEPGNRGEDELSPRAKDIATQTAESMVCSMRGYTLYLREINAFMAFIGISKEPKFAEEKAMVDYDVQIFQDRLLEVLER
ncbi:MAG: hypothetical protein Q9183_007764 [Haloplaca sp. 2 TL-2023]